MMKPFFMLPGGPFDFYCDHFHCKVSMEVGVPNVPGRINDGPEYFVLKPLDDSNIVCGFMFVSFGSCAKLIRVWGGGGGKHGMTVQSVAGGKYDIL
jgi:hypothetical protein